MFTQIGHTLSITVVVLGLLSANGTMAAPQAKRSDSQFTLECNVFESGVDLAQKIRLLSTDNTINSPNTSILLQRKTGPGQVEVQYIVSSSQASKENHVLTIQWKTRNNQPGKSETTLGGAFASVDGLALNASISAQLYVRDDDFDKAVNMGINCKRVP